MISCGGFAGSSESGARRGARLSKGSIMDDDTHSLRELNDTITINLSGSKFEVMHKTLLKYPESKLGSLENFKHHYRPEKNDYYFDRSPYLFDTILNFYRHGELHIPSSTCCVLLKKELLYWGISDKVMEDCCWVPYNSNINRISSLKRFKETVVVPGSASDLAKKGTCHGRYWAKYQPKIWTFLDVHNSSLGAKIFVSISVILVLLTTFTFVAETMPCFKKNTTYSNYDRLFDPTMEPSVTMEDSSRGVSESQVIEAFSQADAARKARSTGPRTFDFLRDFIFRRGNYDYGMGNDNRRSTDRSRRGTEITQDSDLYTQNPDQTGYRQNIRLEETLHMPNRVFDMIDFVAYMFFTLELLLRIIFCPDKCAFFKNGLNIIDILALLPYYIEIIVHILSKRERHQETFLDALYVLRIIRIFRIFRMVRHYKGLQVLLYTLKASANEILLMTIFLSLGMLIFASLIYYTKGPDDEFTSIPHAFWWAVVTMTTVGYGDMVPKTGLGYLIGSFCALSGVLVISFTVPVIVNNFMLFYQHIEYNKRDKGIEEAKSMWLEGLRQKSKMLRKLNGRVTPPKVILHSPSCEDGEDDDNGIEISLTGDSSDERSSSLEKVVVID